VTNSVVSVYRINDFGDLPSGALEELDLADAIIYGSLTYMSGPAWQFKKFADSSAKAFFARKWKEKLAAGFTNSASINGDKYSTIQYFWMTAAEPKRHRRRPRESSIAQDRTAQTRDC
jgi:NAD(P)H dehydrogenase (quinone)